jgi:hypothetical protein
VTFRSDVPRAPLLILSFVVGLVAMLGYVLWYLRLLRAAIRTATTDTTD